MQVGSLHSTVSKMASWVKKMLFGRQLSHGSDTENPQSFEEALQPPPLQGQQNIAEVWVHKGGQASIRHTYVANILFTHPLSLSLSLSLVKSNAFIRLL